MSISTGRKPTGRASNNWIVWLVLGVVLVAALGWGALRDPGPQTDQDRVTSLARTIKCPGCAGETVAESNAASSREIRIDIATRIGEGQSDDEIRGYYAATYGEAILLTPGGSGTSALVWAIPVVVVALTGFGLAVVFLRRRSRADEGTLDDSGAGAEEASVPDQVGTGSQDADDTPDTAVSTDDASQGTTGRGATARIVAVAAVVVVVAGGVGWWVASSSGSRGPSDTLTGDVRASTIAEISDANEYTALANQLLNEGRGDEAIAAYQEAIAAYDRVLELEPRHVEAMTYRGWLLHNIALSASPAAAAELDARAVEWLSQAIAVDPGYADARIFRAILLRDSNPVAALADLETVAPAAVPPAMREMVDALRRQVQEAAAATTATTG